MSRDLTATLRDRLLREDHARAGREYEPVEPLMDDTAVDYTRAEVERMLSDPDELLRAEQLQAEYTAKLEETQAQPRNG